MIIKTDEEKQIIKKRDNNLKILTISTKYKANQTLQKKLEIFSIDQKEEKQRVIDKSEKKVESFLKKKTSEYYRKCMNEIKKLSEQQPKKNRHTFEKHNRLLDVLLGILQLYARLRDTDQHGRGVCISCGKKIHYSNGCGGHFISRIWKSVCLSLFNINLQCNECNAISGTKSDPKMAKEIEKNYRKNLVSKVSLEIVQDLEEMKMNELSNPVRFGRIDINFIKEQIEYYTPIVKKMKAEKMPR